MLFDSPTAHRRLSCTSLRSSPRGWIASQRTSPCPCESTTDVIIATVDFALDPGETLESAIATDSAKFGVTITPVPEQSLNGHHTVTVTGPDDNVNRFMKENHYDED
jgi:hypothetical protein